MGLAAVTAGAAVWVAWPAAAHETTTTTVAGMAGMTGMSGMTTTPPGAAAMVDAAGGGAESGLWPGLAVALAVSALATVVLVQVRRHRSLDAPPASRLDVVGAGALVFAGVAHCALLPSHWAEGWHLGAFFAASGLLLVGQGALVGLRPSVLAYGSVLASTTVLVALYFLAREVALPLVDHRDPYLLGDVPVKVAEVAAALVAGVAMVRARGRSRAPLAPHPAVALAP